MARSTKDSIEFAKIRNMPVEEVKQSEVFYIGNMAEMLLPKYLDDVQDFGVISENNGKPIFSNRWGIPIKDRDGTILNLVGYSSDAKERYIYGTARYYRRRDTLYGLENLDLAYRLGYAILTEGITDAMRIRSLGYKNAFARCGTHKSDYMLRQLNRCRFGVIEIPDRDVAGRKSEKLWDFNRSVKIYVSIQYKDCDEMLRSGENTSVFMSCLNQSIKDVTAMEHRGEKSKNTYYTIM
jgi:DNA primase